MITNEKTFKNTDGLTLFYHEWLPEADDIRAIVLIVHGHGEHSGRYSHVAESFTQVGFACYGIDHRGHGKSAGEEVYIPDMRLAVEDLHQLYTLIQPQYNNLPCLIFAHSMGTLISLEYTLRYQEDVKAIALTGTAITGEELQPAWLISLAIQAGNVIPKVRLSPPMSPDVLTTDPEQIKLWHQDPMTYKKMWRVGTSSAMALAGRRIREQADQLTLPILALHGGADELTPSSGATFLKDNTQSKDVTVKIYDGLRHELVNEVDREAIIQEITAWLVQHS